MRRSWAVVGRRWCSTSASRIGVERFFNREAEISSLNAVLRPSEYAAPGRLMAILGPKDSGKTALVQEFRRRQSKEGLPGVSAYIDLREQRNKNPDEFAFNLWKSLGASVLHKVEAQVDSQLTGKWGFSISNGSFNASTPMGSVSVGFKDDGNALSMVFLALEEYCSKLTTVVFKGYLGGFPTIFIDEANVLQNWDTDQVNDLMRHLVRISKQECGANVVLLSSENFFKTWLEGSQAIKGHELMTRTIGNFPKDEAKEFLRVRVKDPERRKEVEEIWDDVFEHIGGGPLELWRFSGVVINAERGLVQQAWQDWKEEKVYSALAKLKAHAFRPIMHDGSSGTWTKEEFMKVAKEMVQKPDGAVPYSTVIEAVNSVDAMIAKDLLQYRTYGWDRDLTGVEATDYPIVMPADRLQFVAMKMLLDVKINK